VAIVTGILEARMDTIFTCALGPKSLYIPLWLKAKLKDAFVIDEPFKEQHGAQSHEDIGPKRLKEDF